MIQHRLFQNFIQKEGLIVPGNRNFLTLATDGVNIIYLIVFLHDLHRALMNTSSLNHSVQFSIALFDFELTSLFLLGKI